MYFLLLRKQCFHYKDLNVKACVIHSNHSTLKGYFPAYVSKKMF
jgi:hypothetical protein